MRKYLYLIKKQKIKSWLKFWLLTRDKVNYILSEIIEGISFNLQNTVKRYFKIFNIFGNSIQDGTPNPENPVPIESVADDVNLFDINSTVGENNNFTKTIENNHLTLTATGTNGAQYVSNYVKNVDSSKKYTLSFKAKKTVKGTDGTPVIQIIVYGSNDDTNYTLLELSRQDPVEGQEYSFNKTVTGYNYYRFFIYNNASTPVTVGEKTEYWDIKFQKGSVATPYSPYNYGTFTIDFEGQTENYNYTFITKPLRSLPNGVRDTIEADGIHRRVGRIVLNGSENWGTVGNDRYYIAISNKRSVSEYIKAGLSSNYFQSMKYTGGIPNIGYISENYYTGGNINVFFNYNGSNNDMAGFKTWLSTHNTEVLYQLAEEIIEPFTEEQQAEYDKIKELYTFDGTTNISSDDVVPPYLQIQYYMKGE